MHRLLVLYPEPHDRNAFIEYYTNTHLPLAAQLPGIIRWDYAVDISEEHSDETPYFAVFEADFDDQNAFRAAMSSPEGLAVSDDVPNYATGGATVVDFTLSGGSRS